MQLSIRNAANILYNTYLFVDLCVSSEVIEVMFAVQNIVRRSNVSKAKKQNTEIIF